MDKNLSWFLGPKAENASTFEDLLHDIVNDCFYWRKNYFPDDPLLITKSDRHDFDKENDKLYQNVYEFLAALRRNFPFYNPRYIAHMLSDVTMPSLLGYIGGLLYNPNNVTTEAAPVTTEWEIEACNQILQMIGYKLPPVPPKSNKDSDREIYNNKLKDEFGWAHICSGGTLANIEALWVARCVKYLPLSIKDTIKSLQKKSPKLSLKLKTPSGKLKDITRFKGLELINIKPTESIYLLSKYIQTYVDYVKEEHASEKEYVVDLKKASSDAMSLLSQSPYSLSNNMGRLLKEYPLAIFVSGTAHYSIHKAADLLGIGRNNIIFIEIGPDFRMNTENLEKEIRNCYSLGISPLAVIGIVGTTEEGAIDPIHEICDIRKKFEDENRSFWIHVDSAWGGYCKSILQLDDEQSLRILVNKILGMMINKVPRIFVERGYIKRHSKDIYKDTKEGLDIIKDIIKDIINSKIALIQTNKKSINNKDPYKYYRKVKDELRILSKLDTKGTFEEFKEKNNNIIESLPSLKEMVYKPRNYTPDMKKVIEKWIKSLKKEKEIFSIYKIEISVNKGFNDIDSFLAEKDYKSAIQCVTNLYIDIFILLNKDGKDKEDFKNDLRIGREDRVKEIRFFTNYSLDICYKGKHYGAFKLNGDDNNFVSAYLAFKYADSVTIDPHKMGYLPYPCGVIAFKNDRIRHLIAQDAPYITSSNSSVLVHRPPLHSIDDEPWANSNEKRGNCIDAFAPFILEGSKPGAAAASLWLTNKCIPLTVNGYGKIIRESLLSARAFYTSIKKWNEALDGFKVPTNYKLIPISNAKPDLNVVVFAVKGKKLKPTLENMNDLTNKIYQKYSLQVELGNREYSYGQPFFLSKTTFSHPLYSYNALSDFFTRSGIKCTRQEYEDQGLIVLRATLMNPYLWAYKEEKNYDLINDFMINLHNELEELLKSPNRGRRKVKTP